MAGTSVADTATTDTSVNATAKLSERRVKVLLVFMT
jgi:hypothetical protein